MTSIDVATLVAATTPDPVEPPSPDTDQPDALPEPDDRQVLTITPAEIVRRIGLPVALVDGRYVCPVCSLSYQHPEAFGPHMRTHWGEAGVKKADMPNGKQRVKCSLCTFAGKRSSIPGHLHNVHKFDQPTANGLARVLGFDLDAYLRPRPSTSVASSTPKIKHEDRQRQLVDCQEDGCGATMARSSLGKHLEKVHKLDRPEANRIARTLPKSKRSKPHQSAIPYKGNRVGYSSRSKALAPVAETVRVEAPPVEDVPTSNWTQIEPGDIAVAVVQSQVNGTMPTDLLPDVIAYVDATRLLVGRLRERR